LEVRILALLNSAFNASFAIAICIMVRNNMLFNVAFKERLQYLLTLNQTAFNETWKAILWSGVAITVVICILDSVNGLVKGLK
jgi:hypothetical protein